MKSEKTQRPKALAQKVSSIKKTPTNYINESVLSIP